MKLERDEKKEFNHLVALVGTRFDSLTDNAKTQLNQLLQNFLVQQQDVYFWSIADIIPHIIRQAKGLSFYVTRNSIFNFHR